MRSKSGTRPTRMAELLRERLALILLHKVADPRLRELTITDVEMTPDLKMARIFFVLREGSDATQVQTALGKARGFIKQELAREHMFRVMPEIFFLPDKNFEQAQRLEKLFQGLPDAEESGA